ncbi:MAG: BrnT family toxin [Beijerinckiaceae bacterium]
MYEWDEAKARANVAKHGVAFALAIRIFDGPVFTRVDGRDDYGELREVSIGVADGVVVLTVAHTDRDGVTRIISARRATRSERERYGEALRKGLVG